MLRVGLTGGIGSGKSSVSKMLARRGAVVIDSDILAREVVAAGTPGLAEIVEAFGPGVLTHEGELDRPAMGCRVFDDAAARRQLESIIHPRVRARAAEIERAAPADSVVVHDMSLLVETGQVHDFDVVVVVDTPTDVQRERLSRERGLTPGEADARINAQATRDQRLEVADRVVVNAGSFDELQDAVEDLWAKLTARV
ncbi:MAG: dephospho-CoA kinase [Nocardioidaceae bacterium]|nr:dephospho-CoA kinase [Nocardioidaceae bacterium]